MKTLFIKPLFTASVISLALSACNLAPKYEQPQIQLPSTTFQHDTAQGQVQFQAAKLGWQDYFADPRLHQLIELALKNNTDLRTAALNAEQVRATYAITRSALLPNLGAEAGAKRAGSSQAIGESYNVGLGVTGFELDLWGRVRNSSQAALQNYFAVQANRDAAQLSLIASVAKAHFAEIHAQNAMQLAQRVLASREETHRLSQLRHKAGVISALQLHQQTALIEQAKSSYAVAVQAKEQARNALQLLISDKLPENLPEPLPLNQQFTIRHLPAGLSSDLLLNRPDIIAAEHTLKQHNANIGAARAAFFPRISLTGSLGLNSSQLDNLFQSANKVWSFGGGLSLPIFDFGANSARLESAKIEQQKAIVAYEAAVESAFRDVANALTARASLSSQYQSDTAQSKAYNETLRLTHLRHKYGIASTLDLLEAERSSYNAANTLLTTERTLADNLADLYKVLGGGLKRHTSETQH
ncbi:MAG: efflux transporter outer membrane subunit [Alysiella sp.]|uniref:efflux transporter outer membrane subunit n=1 Tax=Alysiella sp. TaxID=1872483 RepID=UPI0026DD8C4D|nr:efflux transporter outer membrane subunit [Alysiella sp.]MDO4434630.1 efflux transporter outer membrane subunit [Alysiella sp.]